MPVISPKTLDHPDRPVGCQEAIGEAVRTVADEALAKGWGREEITVALMGLLTAGTLRQPRRRQQAIALPTPDD